MELMNKLYRLFRHFDTANFPLPMADTFDSADADFRNIIDSDAASIDRLAVADAESWGTQIQENPGALMESRIQMLRNYYTYACECEQAAEQQDREYRHLAFCFYKCAIFHAAVLYRECCKIGQCADIFFILSTKLDNIFQTIGFWDYDGFRHSLCQHCTKDCEHRICQPLETKTQTVNGENFRHTTSHNDGQLDSYPEIRTFFDRLVKAGYLNKDYSTTNAMNDTFAAIAAHEIALELKFKSIYPPFESFWGLKDLRSKYNKAKGRDTQKKEEYKKMLSVMFRKNSTGIDNEIIDVEKVNKAMKGL